MRGLSRRRHATQHGTQHNDVVRCDLLRRRLHAPLLTIRGQVHWHLRAIIKNYRDALAAHAILYRLFDKAAMLKKIRELHQADLMDLRCRLLRGNDNAFFKTGLKLK